MTLDKKCFFVVAMVASASLLLAAGTGRIPKQPAYHVRY